MTRRPTVLLLGATGQIGSEMRSTMAEWADVTAPTRAELDLSRVEDAAQMVAHLRPQLVVNAAAYTRVDDAERDREAAAILNAELPGALAASCQAVGAKLLHFSTDYVFPGDATRPYRESDPTGPINWYGETKLRGEGAALAECEYCIVLRTSWIYGRTGTNFLCTMLRLARERDVISVVNDQRGSPTASTEVAGAAASILRYLEEGNASWYDSRGVYHLTASGSTTWFEFAQRILERNPHRATQITRVVRPITTAEFPTPAARPAYSVLDCSAVAERFAVRLPSWEEQLDRVLAS